jgi:hypothetical protein
MIIATPHVKDLSPSRKHWTDDSLFAGYIRFLVLSLDDLSLRRSWFPQRNIEILHISEGYDVLRKDHPWCKCNARPLSQHNAPALYPKRQPLALLTMFGLVYYVYVSRIHTDRTKQELLGFPPVTQYNVGKVLWQQGRNKWSLCV